MNRKDRRKAEKEMGLLKKNANKSWKERQEIYKRKQEIGKRIHQENLERIYNQQIEQDHLNYQKKLNNLIELGHSIEDAKEMLKNNFVQTNINAV